MTTNVNASVLYAALAASGSSAALALEGDVNTVDVYLQEGASDGGGTLKLQSSADGGTTWVDVPSASWTSGDGHLGRYTVFGNKVRVNLAGATGPSGMVVQLVAVALSPAVVMGENANLAADGNVTKIIQKETDTVWLFAEGTFGSGTLKVQMSPDAGTTWYDTGISLTAAGGASFSNDSNLTVFRLVLSGSTSPDIAYRMLAL